MPDQYTEVTRTGWGKRLGNSFGGILVGIILFFASFGLLFWNEGRVDMSKVADDATPINATAEVDSSLNNTLVAVSGSLTTDDLLGDEYLRSSNYLELRRKVEVYAWVEKSESESEVKLGGSEETKTTYSYVKEWVSSAPNSSNFKIPEGHSNVASTISESTITAKNVKVGNLSVDSSSLGMPGSDAITLSEEMLETLPYNAKLSGEYIYFGFSPTSPTIGDMRVTYNVSRSGVDVTVFGKLDGQNIKPFVDKDGKTLYRATVGSFEQGVSQMSGEHKTSTWLLRLVGFLMMWFGLYSVFGPLSILLDVLPIAGKISRSVVGMATFVVALVLSIVTIIVSMIIHSLLALVIVVVVGIAFTVWYIKKKGAKMAVKK
ncbi:TMEM43 family protein [Patescibacteria group bacterium]|nr:TMEM43 family protein [Patescibacteria group bacterium]MBU1895967.1 TMEM43 family protein [Patescibacteria group bacterium]